MSPISLVIQDMFNPDRAVGREYEDNQIFSESEA